MVTVQPHIDKHQVGGQRLDERFMQSQVVKIAARAAIVGDPLSLLLLGNSTPGGSVCSHLVFLPGG